MNVAVWTEMAINRLAKAGVATATLDAEILLADELQKDRSWLHAHGEQLLNKEIRQKLDEQIGRRSKHEPLAYIRGKQEFFSRDFEVSPDTLTPRPETETLVDMALDSLNKNNIKSVADIGSGCGCIIITLVLEAKQKFEASGYEISATAIEIARRNARKLHARVRFVRTDIRTSLKKDDWKNTEMIVANLPYVPDDFKINLAASHEPARAIFGGADGLDYYRHLFSKVREEVRFVITESLPPQHNKLEQIAIEAGFRLDKSQDFIQLFVR